ncbi:MAG: glycerol-3-phosphate 1-O-acyltransferase PlsY [Candidatus Obscuribacterales bacterium]|nr:glycerol-3-phosphate 1-O-acyltransferase PlsY [Candidatus Obscuribacterales bacterium]
MLAILLLSVISYLMGAIPTGYWVGKIVKGIDIRTVGSCSTGATNVLRSVGKGPAVFVLIFDMFKGAFPVLLGIAACDPQGHQSMPIPAILSLTADSSLQNSPFVTYYVMPAITGIISMIGHSKSIFLNMQGGKSAATGLGTLAAMNPTAGALMFVVFVLTIYIGRYVSVGSMMAAFVGPVLMYAFGGKMSFVIYNIVGSSYVIFRHKANIKRLLSGTEPKIGEKAKLEEKNENSDGKGDATKTLALMLAVLGLNCFLAADAETLKKASPDKLIKASENSRAKIIAVKQANSAAKSNNSRKDDAVPAKVVESFASAPPAPVTAEEATTIKVYKTDSKAVVNVTTSNVTPETVMYGLAPAADTGSGSIISTDGYVLTNNHVINGASMVKVTLFDGTPFPAKLVGVDPDNDIAVLKIDPGARKLSTIKFGDSSKLEVGRRVYAIGNPFGLDLTMTSGIISSVGRTLRTEHGRVIKGVLQTDAAINPGNSGGPLLDTQGNMVGVTTAILSKVQQSAGIGFAIPVNVVKRVVPQLIAHGAILRPDLGILRVYPTQMGLMIVAVDPNGPAADAGLHGPTVRRYSVGGFDFNQVDNSAADIIVGIDAQRVNSVDDLLSYVESKKPGQVVTLNVLRQGQVTRIQVKLAQPK